MDGVTVWVVTENGWRRGFGIELYLIGVFDNEEIANEVASASSYRQVTSIDMNVAHTLNKDSVSCDYYNTYYLGGYCE